MASFSIDPKVQMAGAAALAVLGFVASASPSIFPSYIPAGAVADITKTAGLVAGLLSAIFGVVAAYGSSKPGPLAPPDPPIVKAATVLATLPDNTPAPQVLRAATDLHIEAIKEAPGAYANGQLKK